MLSCEIEAIFRFDNKRREENIIFYVFLYAKFNRDKELSYENLTVSSSLNIKSFRKMLSHSTRI